MSEEAKNASGPTGPEVIDEMVKDPTLDSYMRRHPSELSDEQIRAFIQGQRRERAAFVQKRMEK